MTDRETPEAEDEWAPPPPITLFADGSAASQEAFRALEEARFRFRVVPADNGTAPVAEWGGLTFEGVQGTRDLVRILQRFNETLRKRIQAQFPHLLERAAPERARAAEQRRLRALETARAQLRALQTADIGTSAERATPRS